jgi:hypothetical protein
MLPPLLFSKRHSSDEEVAEWEAQQAKLGQDYDSPWLSGMVTFSGFVAARSALQAAASLLPRSLPG